MRVTRIIYLGLGCMLAGSAAVWAAPATTVGSGSPVFDFNFSAEAPPPAPDVPELDGFLLGDNPSGAGTITGFTGTVGGQSVTSWAANNVMTYTGSPSTWTSTNGMNFTLGVGSGGSQSFYTYTYNSTFGGNSTIFVTAINSTTSGGFQPTTQHQYQVVSAPEIDASVFSRALAIMFGVSLLFFAYRKREEGVELV